jgi:hypothetical protein
VSSGIAPIAPSVPEVTAVEFTDEARTRATVRLSSAPGIGTVYLEKDSGLWRSAGVDPGFSIC